MGLKHIFRQLKHRCLAVFAIDPCELLLTNQWLRNSCLKLSCGQVVGCRSRTSKNYILGRHYFQSVFRVGLKIPSNLFLYYIFSLSLKSPHSMAKKSSFTSTIKPPQIFLSFGIIFGSELLHENGRRLCVILSIIVLQWVRLGRPACPPYIQYKGSITRIIMGLSLNPISRDALLKITVGSPLFLRVTVETMH